MLLKNLRPIGIVLVLIGLGYLYMLVTSAQVTSRHPSFAVFVTSLGIIIAGLVLIFSPRKF